MAPSHHGQTQGFHRAKPAVGFLAAGHVPDLHKALLNDVNECAAVGSVQTASIKMHEFVEKTGVDELMCVCAIYDYAKRLESFRLAVEAFRNH